MSPAQAITTALRGKWYGTYGAARCPVHEDTNPSLVVRDGDEKGRLLVRCFAGCAAPDILAALRRHGRLDDPVRHERSVAERPRRNDVDRSRRALRLWNETVSPAGTPTATYWRDARALSLPIPPTIRHHSAARHETGMFLPAMLGAVTVWPSRQVQAVHRTFLTQQGRKAPLSPDKAMLGPVAQGAVRLGPAAAEMAIGEGIESSASFMQATDISTWASLSTSGLRSVLLPPLPLGKIVHIVADADGPGEKAAQAAAARLHGEGRDVKIIRPVGVKDFNDLVRDAAHV